MWSTEVKAKVKRQKAKEKARARRGGSARRLVIFCLFTFAFCLLTGCRMDMQDQPKYKTFRAGDEMFGVSGASVRPLVEGTVPRRAGGPYRDREVYFYTGKTASYPGGGVCPWAMGGGVG